ncbi:MAG: hypothetical protein ACK56F_27630 [bacterium]
MCRGGECVPAECARALRGLALPRASRSGEIALADSRRLRPTLVVAPVLFAHAVVIVAKTVHAPPLQACNYESKSTAGHAPNHTQKYRRVPKFSPYG